jgi:proline racemase
VTVAGGVIHPHIRGSAFVNAEAELIVDDLDPFAWGIVP